MPCVHILVHVYYLSVKVTEEGATKYIKSLHQKALLPAALHLVLRSWDIFPHPHWLLDCSAGVMYPVGFPQTTMLRFHWILLPALIGDIISQQTSSVFDFRKWCVGFQSLMYRGWVVDVSTVAEHPMFRSLKWTVMYFCNDLICKRKM